jgi:hypothetical protein
LTDASVPRCGGQRPMHPPLCHDQTPPLARLFCWVVPRGRAGLFMRMDSPRKRRERGGVFGCREDAGSKMAEKRRDPGPQG